MERSSVFFPGLERDAGYTQSQVQSGVGDGPAMSQ